MEKEFNEENVMKFFEKNLQEFYEGRFNPVTVLEYDWLGVFMNSDLEYTDEFVTMDLCTSTDYVDDDFEVIESFSYERLRDAWENAKDAVKEITEYAKKHLIDQQRSCF